MEDASLTDITGVVADGDLPPYVRRQGSVSVAVSSEPDPIGVYLACLSDCQEQKVELL